MQMAKRAQARDKTAKAKSKTKAKTAKAKTAKAKTAKAKTAKTGARAAAQSKAISRKSSVKKAPAKKSATKKSAVKKAPAKKTEPKKTAPKKAQSKARVKKTQAKKAQAKKAQAKKAQLKKSQAKKAAANKPAKKKVAVKNSPKSQRPAKTTQQDPTTAVTNGVVPKLASIPRISIREFSRRRQRLMDEMEPGSIAVLPAAQMRTRNRDVDYLFRQDSDFYYLSGCVEAQAWLVLAPGREHGEVILFCEERDPEWERWNGERMGPERATQLLGVDDAFPIGDIGDILPGMLEGRARVYATLGDYPEFDKQMLSWIKGIRAREAGGARPPGEFVALRHLLHEQRLYKSAAELALMREAARITAAAHVRAMRAAAPGVTEGQLEAELTHEFMRHGARHPAYPCIVGSGANACVLHYIDNDRTMKRGDLVLIDAGCEYEHYAADVTRTFPVDGQFSAEQQTLYELVLEANEQGIAACRVGNSFNDPHEVSLRVMIQGLVDLGLLEGSVDGLLERGEYRRFCPHKASHWLGIDVHDVGDYRIDDTWRQLEPGMVLTIEPGIYVPRHAAQGVAARWIDIGIRIEDDVLVTAQGPEVLTAGAPKTIAAIEAVMTDD